MTRRIALPLGLHVALLFALSSAPALSGPAPAPPAAR